VLLRNTTAKTAKINLSFHWRNAVKDGRASIPEITLAPFESHRVDVQALQNFGAIPLDAFWAQVTMTTDTLPNEVMAVAASYDAKLRYGAQTPFSDQLIAHLEGGQWQVDANHTSLIAAGNGGTKEVQAALTFFYDQGRKQYRLEKTISADDQWWVDIGQLIRSQIPDKNGNTLPPDLTSGAYRLQEVSETHQDLLYEGKVITDKTYGHATYGCMVCCGYPQDSGGPFILANPTGVAVADSTYADVYGVNGCTGNADWVGGYFPTWWSSDNSILTADDFQITGVALGSTYANASASAMPSGDGEDSPDGCPFVPAQSTGTANVVPIVTNFHQTIGRDQGNGVLGFEYHWNSSSGNLADLSQCSVREVVTYPGSGDYAWSSPPYATHSETNPTILATAATGGVGNDVHSPGSGFTSTYVSNSFTATQKYQFSCTNYNSGTWNDLVTGISIVRTVSQNADSSWKYTITKSGVSASINPLP
jgi:hypothetical protein